MDGRVVLNWHFRGFPGIQWLRLRLPGQGLQVPSLARELRCPHALRAKHQNTEQKRGLPWWLSGKEPICQCRGHGFYPWSGKIPTCGGETEVSPGATTTEHTAATAEACTPPESVLHSKGGTAMRSPHTTARAKARAAVKTRPSQK